MAVSENYLSFVKDQLSDFDGVEMKKMFGGVGCFKEGVMFGMIDSSDRFRLRVDATNQKAFEDRGMQAFYSGKMKKGMPYWEVPAEILEDKTTLAKWADEAFRIAKKHKKK